MDRLPYALFHLTEILVMKSEMIDRDGRGDAENRDDD